MTFPVLAAPERHVVDFGPDSPAAYAFLGTLSRLGLPATCLGSRVTIDDSVLSALFPLPYDSDGAIIGHRDGKTRGVRISGYAYTLWPESAGPKLATRWHLAR
jgi:hypothetical protein